jgi:hypothetical protein
VLAITMKLDAFFRFDGPQDDKLAQAIDETPQPGSTRPVSTREVRR